MTDPYVVVDAIGSQDGQRYRYRCARSLDGLRWSVICADNVTGAYSESRERSQAQSYAELVDEMHPFERMKPRPSLEMALAEWGQDED